MDQPNRPPLSPFELLARQWPRPAAVERVVFNHDLSAVAFAAADGTLALAAMADPEPPAKRVRVSNENGRATIRPREKPGRPATVVGPVDERAPVLAPYRLGSFAVAGHAGRVLAITARGQITPFHARLAQRVTAIDRHAASARTACAAGGEVALFADDDTRRPLRLQHELPLAAIALSPDGAELAAAHESGVSIWRLTEPSLPRRELPCAGGPQAVSWSPDGQWLACPLAEAGFQLLRVADGAGRPLLGYPTPVRSLAWSRGAQALVTAGAFRATAWSMLQPPLDDSATGALQTGRPGLVVIDCVAAHPQRDLIAVGYASGQVSIMQLGRRDEFLLRQEGGGSVHALAWSSDGEHLAIGDAAGTAAVASFPPHLFK